MAASEQEVVWLHITKQSAQGHGSEKLTAPLPFVM